MLDDADQYIKIKQKVSQGCIFEYFESDKCKCRENKELYKGFTNELFYEINIRKDNNEPIQF